MGSDPALRTECEHHVRTENAHLQDEIAHNAVEILLVKMTVRIIQHHASADAENLAGLQEFLSPGLDQFRVVFCAAAVRGRLPRRKTNHRGLYSSVRIQPQHAAKTGSLIIGMSGNAQESKHA